MKILVTGGAGYIGSHTIVELLQDGHEVVVIDNLCNSNITVIDRIKSITGKVLTFFEADIRDFGKLNSILNEYPIDCCVHFAGLKSVRESVENPLKYYENNVGGTQILLKALKDHDCKNVIFSSSATVYGVPPFNPITEECPVGVCASPYGRTKVMIEQMLKDLVDSDSDWNIVTLRYFNPIGAHTSGKIGENSVGIPNNLMPYITQVATGQRKFLNIFGNDYDTPDGTCIRDYIHVVDLARGHLFALKDIIQKKGWSVYNLGTGQGYSVLEVVHTFEKVNNIKIPYVFAPRRFGDISEYYANPMKAQLELNWKATLSLADMCRDSWRWQKQNPNGYE
ncbi:MAG: UDP-glucose 4-epimerase GalE [Alphaproteobacteria bacterium]|nr:UDP-glucose 4-epimerase GalE [Alphaproteobacteria bacterium]